ncbi:MAG: NADPH:quinone oxidoreductase family protein [Actinomycetota bacterium]
MRRVMCHEFGPLENLTVEEFDAPEPGPGQVLVDVRAAGVNFVDSLFVRGAYQIKPPTPFTPGGEVAGVVSAVGDGADGFAPGDRVIASCGLGGFAEQVVAGAGSVFPLPDAVAFDIGATVVQSYATALFSLTRRTVVARDEWVLVLGAGGGVGLACIDVARSLGAHVIGVASSDDKRRAAADAGAEATIDSTNEDVKLRARELSGGGVDVVVDPVGGPSAKPALRALRTYGRYLVVGFAAGEIPRLPLNLVLLNNRTIIGVDWGGWAMRNVEDNRALVAQALEGVASGRLHPVTPSSLPLDQVVDALRDFEERRVTGKVVLVP